MANSDSTTDTARYVCPECGTRTSHRFTCFGGGRHGATQVMQEEPEEQPACTCTQRLYGVAHGVNCPLRIPEWKEA